MNVRKTLISLLEKDVEKPIPQPSLTSEDYAKMGKAPPGAIPIKRDAEYLLTFKGRSEVSEQEKAEARKEVELEQKSLSQESAGEKEILNRKLVVGVEPSFQAAWRQGRPIKHPRIEDEDYSWLDYDAKARS